MNKRNLNVKKD